MASRRFEGGRPVRNKQSSRKSNDESQSTTTIRKGGETTVIVRRSAAEGGTYSYKVKDGQAVSGSFRGGSNVKSQREATKQSVGLADQDQTTTASATVKQNLLQGQPTQPSPTVEAQMRPETNSVQFNPVAGGFSPRPDAAPSILSNQQTYVATGVSTGRPVTQEQALRVSSQPKQKGVIESFFKGTKVYESGRFFTKEDPTDIRPPFQTFKQKDGGVFDIFKQGSAQITDTELVSPPKTYQPKTKEEVAEMVGAGVTVAATSVAGPFGFFVTGGPSIAADVAGVTIKKYKEATRKEGTIFAPIPFVKGKPEEETKFAQQTGQFVEAKQAGLASSEQARADEPYFKASDYGVLPFKIPAQINIPKIGSKVLPATFASSEAYEQGVRDYYKEQGLTGEELSSAVKSQLTELKASRVADIGLVGAEFTSELIGSGKYKVVKYGDDALSFVKSRVAKSATAGQTEAAIGIEVWRQNILDAETSEKEIAAGRGLGAGTAGVFTAVQTSVSPFKRRFVTGGGYLTEPLEPIGDLTASPVKKAFPKLFDDGVPTPTLFTPVTGQTSTPTQQETLPLISITEQEAQYKPTTLQQDVSQDFIPSVSDTRSRSRTRTKLFDRQAGPQTNVGTGVPTQTDVPTRIPVQSETNIGVFPITNTNVPTQVPTETFTETLVQSQTKTQVPTKTFTYVPSFAPLPLFGGFGIKRRRPARGKQRTQYTPTAFAALTGIEGKKTRAGVTTGLGIRPLQPAPKKRKKKKGRQLRF